MECIQNVDPLLTSDDVDLLSECMICPVMCRINRFDRKGACRTGADIVVASINLHTGEEPPISGTKGSGTVFFAGCNLHCDFCQNYPISQLGNGRKYSIDELSDEMIVLQKRGAHNINFVTPSHYVVQMRRAVIIAREKGLNIPILYNTSGYDSIESIKLLDGIVDIYLPDIRYQNADLGEQFSHVKNYPNVNKLALKEMFHQVGNLQLNDDGIATKGMIIRHLVLPGGYADTKTALEFIANEISNDMHISLMSQYFPAYKAKNIKDLSRKLTENEYNQAVEDLESIGLDNGWIQPYP